MADDYEIVAAIDFGTTYSGYAYCSKTDFKRSPPVIKTSAWKSGTGTCDKFMKTPTVVLFDQNRKFDSFGFEAEKKYLKLALRNQQESWYFFKRFKMRLHQRETERTNERLTIDTIVEDETGKSMKALDVFSSAIQYLKDHLQNLLIEQGMRDKNEVMKKVRWVLTVPAIWTDPAKEFMKEAAIKAGLPENKLLLALEPEAASLCCWSIRNVSPDGRTILTPGLSYTVLDMGGGTADIVTHKIEDGEKLREMHAPVGGDWGGTKVNSSFQGLLIKLVGAPVLSKFKNKHVVDYLEMMNDFEIKKQFVSLENDEEVMLTVPGSLVKIFEEETDGENLSDVIEQTPMKGQLEWTSGRLILQPELFKTFFSISLDNVIKKLKELFNATESQDVSTLLLVGGFSESRILRKAIREAFTDKRIIHPEHPSLAILEGAVIYGHSPMSVKIRICKYTYGFMAAKSIKQHDQNIPKNRTIMDGTCETMIFDKLVEVGQAVEAGSYQVKKTYSKLSPDQSSMILFMYTSTDKDPQYVTDDSCSLLGDLIINLPPGHREVVVSTMFSDTFLTVKAVEKDSNTEVTTRFNFLA